MILDCFSSLIVLGVVSCGQSWLVLLSEHINVGARNCLVGILELLFFAMSLAV